MQHEINSTVDQTQFHPENVGSPTIPLCSSSEIKSTTKRLVSIVLPVYNEEENIPLVIDEINKVISTGNIEYEVIFVDDGSTDKSCDTLRIACTKHKFVKAIFLRRNFGQTAAMSAGVELARGELIVFMDSDLQNDPADIPMLIQKIDEGFDIVSGWRKNRQDTFVNRKLPSFFANKLISIISGVRLHDLGCSLKVYRSELIKEIKLYGEMHRFIPLYGEIIGAKIVECVVNHRPRRFGQTKYSITRTFKVLLDLITIKFLLNFSTRPMYFFGGVGSLLILSSFFCGVIMTYQKFFGVYHTSMIQNPLLLLSAMLFIIGVNFLLMGIMSEIQMRTYYASAGKQAYQIKQVIN